LITAASTQFSLAEYYLKQGMDANAKAAYEAGITQSINFYYWLRTLSNSTVSGDLTPLGPTEINDYLSEPGIDWGTAANTAEKLNRIATQKWINSNVLRPMETWAEFRRLDLPVLTFTPDAGSQQLPPNRWLYPANEITYNSENYNAVKANDNLSTKIFWDTN
jgi:hypothetical protein